MQGAPAYLSDISANLQYVQCVAELLDLAKSAVAANERNCSSSSRQEHLNQGLLH